MRVQLIFGILSAGLIACSSAPAESGKGETPSKEENSTGNSKKGSSGTSTSEGETGDDSTNGGSSSGGTSSGGTSSGGTSSGGTSSSGGTGETGGATCAKSTSLDACFDCCDKANPQGASKADAADTTLMKCQCAADACGSSCGNSFLCDGDTAPSTACTQCLNTNAKSVACENAYDTAMKDPDVVKIESCNETAKCMDKPE